MVRKALPLEKQVMISCLGVRCQCSKRKVGREAFCAVCINSLPPLLREGLESTRNTNFVFTWLQACDFLRKCQIHPYRAINYEPGRIYRSARSLAT